jgi:hypothetical protein
MVHNERHVLQRRRLRRTIDNAAQLVVSADRGQAETQLSPDCSDGAKAYVGGTNIPLGAPPGLYHAVARDPAGDDLAAIILAATYAALRLEIDNWRWSGVPFFIRTGKHLSATQTELRLVFKRPPRVAFVSPGTSRPEPNQLVVKLDPSTGARLLLQAQRADADQPQQINLDMEFADEGGEGATPYEVLLHAALIGNSVRFTRQDGIEEAWRIMQPLLDSPPPVHPYAPGSWGPEEAHELVAGHGWHGPWIAP